MPDDVSSYECASLFFMLTVIKKLRVPLFCICSTISSEQIILEKIPDVNEGQARDIARKLSSLPTVCRSVDCRKGDTSKLRQTLMVVSRKILSIANKKRDMSKELSPPHILNQESTNENSKEPEITKLSPSLTLSDKCTNEQGNLLHRNKNFHDIKCNAKEIKLFRSDSTLWAKFSKVNGLQCEVQLHYSGSITHDREQVPESKGIYYTPGSVEI